jgi:squalene-hopene/tetraprenyl-beta-curcumene cyclase
LAVFAIALGIPVLLILLPSVYALPSREGSAGRVARATGPGEAIPDGPSDLTLAVAAIRALRDAGLPADDPAVRRATEFISRCQAPDASRRGGGFVAEPFGPAVAAAASGPVAAPRPCGALTCIGLSGLLAAGVAEDDARVRSAVAWLEAHYTLDRNPGMDHPRRGLYRYYLELARALTALGLHEIRDAEGTPHDWRDEIAARLARDQRPDGSWANPDESEVAAESGPHVVTSYAVMTLRLILDGRPDDPAPPTDNPR